MAAQSAGQLDRPANVQVATEASDANGAPYITYSTQSDTHWVNMELRGGREFEYAASNVADADALITARYGAASFVTRKDRWIVENRTYAILAVLDEGDNRDVIRFVCKEIVA